MNEVELLGLRVKEFRVGSVKGLDIRSFLTNSNLRLSPRQEVTLVSFDVLTALVPIKMPLNEAIGRLNDIADQTACFDIQDCAQCKGKPTPEKLLFGQPGDRCVAVNQYLHLLIHMGLPFFFRDSSLKELREEVGWRDENQQELLVLFSAPLNQQRFLNSLQQAIRTLLPIFGNGAKVK